MLVYNSALSTANRQAVETYLNHKWQTIAYPDLSMNSTPFSVSPATVVPSVTVSSKTYDGTTNATIATRNLSGIVGSDDVNLDSSGTAFFLDKLVAPGKPVTVTGLSLSGTTAANYVLSTTSLSTSADINVRTLTVSALGVDKTYDGTTNTTVTLSDDRVIGDDVTTAYTTAGFADKNAGTNKPVSVNGISITGGADSGNYVLGNTTASTTATIFTRTLTVSATGINKFYDGTTNATVTLSDDRVAGDAVTTAYTSAGFDDSSVGTNKPVHVAGISITGGADAPDYTLGNSTADTTATISANTANVALASSLNPSAYPQVVTFTATVTSGGGTPTGGVIFLTNGVALSTNTLDGNGVATSAGTAVLPRGTNTISAEYSGSGIFAGVTATNSLDQIITNSSPIAGTAYYTRTSGVSLKILISDLLTNVTDFNNDPISLDGYSPATTNGTTLTTDGTYIFVPANTVDDAFTYTVDDGQGGTNSGTVAIAIIAAPPGQTQATLTLTNGMALVTFAGVPGYRYTADRATNVMFTGTLRMWITNAPPHGVFDVLDDFSDLGGTPDAAYFRLRFTP
jgi:hypothetical protein